MGIYTRDIARIGSEAFATMIGELITSLEAIVSAINLE